MNWHRRQVLRAGGLLVGIVGTAGFGGSAARAEANRPSATARGAGAKRIVLRNVHTSETLDTVYYRENAYAPDALAAIESVLRDHRNGAKHVIDPALMDYLFDVAAKLEVEPVFSVISGYRSPHTNEQLRERTDGVARRSLHLEGRAIDVRLARVTCADLAARAQSMSRGGVGYYAKSDFVHLDTGAYRTWRG